MSDTPRTDAAFKDHSINELDDAGRYYWLAFARQLELELAAMTAERDQWKRRAEDADCSMLALKEYESLAIPFDVLYHEATAIVRKKAVFDKFITGTPLANDVPVWMAVFAQNLLLNSAYRDQIAMTVHVKMEGEL